MVELRRKLFVILLTNSRPRGCSQDLYPRRNATLGTFSYETRESGKRRTWTSGCWDQSGLSGKWRVSPQLAVCVMFMSVPCLAM